MERIRIGKDVTVSFKVLTNGLELPLEGRNLYLEMRNPEGNITPASFTINGNSVETRVKGKDLHCLGIYSYTLWENKGLDLLTVCDINNAFLLVNNTNRET